MARPMIWTQTAHFTRPLILAGGLDPDNVGEAHSSAPNHWAVDVASGIESSPGRKDHARMKKFIEAAHRLNDFATRCGRTLRHLRRALRAGSADGAARRTSNRPTSRPASDPAFHAELHDLLTTYAGRPTPLYYARRLSEHLRGAKIYIKREDLLHTGAHKINNCLGQALLARRMGKRRIIAETGAGQHGVATATVCALFGLDCTVYMGEEDMRRQRLNVFRMRLLGANCSRS